MPGRLIALVGILLRLIVSPARSQVEVRVGAKQGANFASLSGDWRQATAMTTSGAELNRRIGFVFGGLLVLDPAGPLSIQPEVLAIWKGAKSRAGRTETRTTLNYLEVPVMIKYQPFTMGAVTTHLVAGPTVGLATKAERSRITRNGSGEVESSSRTQLNGTVRSFEAGLAAGLQLGYRLSDKVKFMTDVRYQRSLTSAFKGGSSSSSTVDTRNHGVAVTMGIVYSAVGGFW